jgi:hypothetical protein
MTAGGDIYTHTQPEGKMRTAVNTNPDYYHRDL